VYISCHAFSAYGIGIATKDDHVSLTLDSVDRHDRQALSAEFEIDIDKQRVGYVNEN
jgi:hypothetical protein